MLDKNALQFSSGRPNQFQVNTKSFHQMISHQRLRKKIAVTCNCYSQKIKMYIDTTVYE